MFAFDLGVFLCAICAGVLFKAFSFKEKSIGSTVFNIFMIYGLMNICVSIAVTGYPIVHGALVLMYTPALLVGMFIGLMVYHGLYYLFTGRPAPGSLAAKDEE